MPPPVLCFKFWQWLERLPALMGSTRKRATHTHTHTHARLILSSRGVLQCIGRVLTTKLLWSVWARASAIITDWKPILRTLLIVHWSPQGPDRRRNYNIPPLLKSSLLLVRSNLWSLRAGYKGHMHFNKRRLLNSYNEMFSMETFRGLCVGFCMKLARNFNLKLGPLEMNQLRHWLPRRFFGTISPVNIIWMVTIKFQLGVWIFGNLIIQFTSDLCVSDSIQRRFSI